MRQIGKLRRWLCCLEGNWRNAEFKWEELLCTHDIKCLEGRLATASRKKLIVPAGLMCFFVCCFFRRSRVLMVVQHVGVHVLLLITWGSRSAAFLEPEAFLVIDARRQLQFCAGEESSLQIRQQLHLAAKVSSLVLLYQTMCFIYQWNTTSVG